MKFGINFLGDTFTEEEKLFVRNTVETLLVEIEKNITIDVFFSAVFSKKKHADDQLPVDGSSYKDKFLHLSLTETENIQDVGQELKKNILP